MLEEVNCDICGESPSEELLSLHGSAYHRCKNCGLIFTKWISPDYTQVNESAFAAELSDYARKATDQRRQKKTKSALRKFDKFRQ